MEAQVQLITPEIEQSTASIVSIAENVKSLVISTIDDYRMAQGLMSEVKRRIKILTETRMAQTRPLDESKKKIMLFFEVPLNQLDKAKDHLNLIMVQWAEEQERIRKEEERRLQEEARKRAEEIALQEAIQAEKEGNKEEADEILKQEVYVPPVTVMSDVPKSKESHIRETWSAEGFDLMMTIRAIVDGRAPIQAVQYNAVFLNRQATSYKELLAIPGVRAVSKKTQI